MEAERRLQHALEAVERIESRIDGIDEDSFRSDELLQVWVVHHLQIIGEAFRKIPDELKKEYPDVPWKNVIGMRHYLVHEYFRIDLDTAWNVVDDDLPELKGQIDRILEDLE